MAKSSSHTIILVDNGVRRKFCKLLFTGDGTYCVTAPYHSAKKAVLFKATVNYNTEAQLIAFEQTIDLSELDDGRLKISHHPSGFVQYSGDGVLSGLHENGTPKGVGVFSEPLSTVGRGPAVGIGVQDITQLETTENSSKHDVTFNTSEITHLPGANGVMLEAHYFQPTARKFVFSDAQGLHWINVTHPSSIVIRMRVVLAPSECEYPGLIALYMFQHRFDFGGSGFSLTGPGEKMRMNAAGERFADVLMCVYPRPRDFDGAKSLDYRPEKG